MFLVLALMRIPTIILTGASSFAIPYTIANLLILSSGSFLSGWKKQLSSCAERERLPYSMAYVVTMVLTLYLTTKGYHFYLTIPVVILQFIALFLYVMTYIPGGMNCANLCGK